MLKVIALDRNDLLRELGPFRGRSGFTPDIAHRVGDNTTYKTVL